MGRLEVKAATDPAEIKKFGRALLDDLQALEEMSSRGDLEAGTQRIGFEQELFLVDRHGRPSSSAVEVLAALDDPLFTHEIGLFNLEHNVPPTVLGAGALIELERHLNDAIGRIRKAAEPFGADVYLGGILPSIDISDLTLENLTPASRYYALNSVIVELAGGSVRALIQGQDNLQVELDNVMLEACTTSIQVHLQVDPAELPRVYNAAQAISAPLVAVSANAPMLLQHRLWHETRIPTFQQSVDIRSPDMRNRDKWRRVHFGDDWVQESVLEIYRDQVARHRIMLLADTGESSLSILARGETPQLEALSLHNGSLYRWNRPCYGLTNGVPHLRIEHRPLSAGPTVLDEVANTAFYLGLLHGVINTLGDAREHMSFSDTKANFVAAARYGLEASLRWNNGESIRADQLIIDQLVPLADDGLASIGIGKEERDRFLGVIQGRASSGITGARWTLDAYEALDQYRNRPSRTQALTRAMLAREKTGQPVHLWPPLTVEETQPMTGACPRVADIMTTDLFTVRPEDLVDVAASVMSWKHVRHVPVEDDRGLLVGLVSHRDLLGLVARGEASSPTAVDEIMRKSPTTIDPSTACSEALGLLRDGTLGCLPVVDSGRLVGIVTERDFLPFADAWLANKDS